MKKARRLLLILAMVLVLAGGMLIATGCDERYNITVTNGTGVEGNYELSEQGPYAANTVVKLTVTPNKGYKVDSVKIDGNELSAGADGTYSFKVIKEMSIVIGYEEVYSITVKNGTGVEGTYDLSNSGPVGSNTTVTLGVTPNQEYRVSSVKQDGEPLEIGTDGRYSFTVTADTEIEIEYEVIKYTVNVTNGTGIEGNYELSPEGAVVSGTDVTLTITPNRDYKVSVVSLDGEPIEPIEGQVNVYMISNIVRDVSVNITYERLLRTVTVQNGTNGTEGRWHFTPGLNSENKILSGTEVELTVSPEYGYDLDKITVNGEEQTVEKLLNDYTATFEVVEDTEVQITYKQIEYCDVRVINDESKGSYSIIAEYSERDDIKKDTEVTIMFSPLGLYRVKSITIGEEEIEITNDTYTFTLSEDTTITVNYLDVVSVTVIPSDDNIEAEFELFQGDRKLNGFADKGIETTLKIKTPETHTVKTVRIISRELVPEADGSYKFTPNEATIINVDFNEAVALTVTNGTGAEGTYGFYENGVLIDGDKATKGAEVVLKITPNRGFAVKSVTVSGESLTEEDGGYKFTADGPKTIVIEYKTVFYLTVTNGDADLEGIVTRSPDKEFYDNGDSVEITVIANPGYAVNTVTVDGQTVSLQANKFTVEMTKDIEVVITYNTVEIDRYNIVVRVDGGNGEYEITHSKEVPLDTEVTLTLKPDSHYKLKTLTVNNVDVTADVQDNVYKFNIEKETDIVIIYEVASTHNITVTVTSDRVGEEGGSFELVGDDLISEDGQYKAYETTKVTLTVIPAEHFNIKEVKVNNEPVELATGYIHVFTISASDINIEIAFEKITKTITLQNSEGGEATLTRGEDVIASGNKVDEGDVLTLTITPDKGNSVDSVTFNDDPIEVIGETYEFVVTDDVNIVITYKVLPKHKLTVTKNMEDDGCGYRIIYDGEEQNVEDDIIYGTPVTIMVICSDKFRCNYVSVDERKVDVVDGMYSFKMLADTEIHIEYRVYVGYNVSVKNGYGGQYTITHEGEVEQNTEVTLKLTTGRLAGILYECDYLMINGTEKIEYGTTGAFQNNTYKFTVNQDTDIEVFYKKHVYLDNSFSAMFGTWKGVAGGDWRSEYGIPNEYNLIVTPYVCYINGFPATIKNFEYYADGDEYSLYISFTDGNMLKYVEDYKADHNGQTPSVGGYAVQTEYNLVLQWQGKSSISISEDSWPCTFKKIDNNTEDVPMATGSRFENGVTGEEGDIKCDVNIASVNYQTTVEFTVIPNNAYRIKSVVQLANPSEQFGSAKDKSLSLLREVKISQNVYGYVYSFQITSNNTVVKIEYEDLTEKPDLSITVNNGNGGSYELKYEGNVKEGTQNQISITPYSGYVVKSFKINGNVIQVVDAYRVYDFIVNENTVIDIEYILKGDLVLSGTAKGAIRANDVLKLNVDVAPGQYELTLNVSPADKKSLGYYMILLGNSSFDITKANNAFDMYDPINNKIHGIVDVIRATDTSGQTAKTSISIYGTELLGTYRIISPSYTLRPYVPDPLVGEADLDQAAIASASTVYYNSLDRALETGSYEIKISDEATKVYGNTKYTTNIVFHNKDAFIDIYNVDPEFRARGEVESFHDYMNRGINFTATDMSVQGIKGDQQRAAHYIRVTVTPCTVTPINEIFPNVMLGEWDDSYAGGSHTIQIRSDRVIWNGRVYKASHADEADKYTFTDINEIVYTLTYETYRTVYYRVIITYTDILGEHTITMQQTGLVIPEPTYITELAGKSYSSPQDEAIQHHVVFDSEGCMFFDGIECQVEYFSPDGASWTGDACYLIRYRNITSGTTRTMYMFTSHGGPGVPYDDFVFLEFTSSYNDYDGRGLLFPRLRLDGYEFSFGTLELTVIIKLDSENGEDYYVKGKGDQAPYGNPYIQGPATRATGGRTVTINPTTMNLDIPSWTFLIDLEEFQSAELYLENILSPNTRLFYKKGNGVEGETFGTSSNMQTSMVSLTLPLVQWTRQNEDLTQVTIVIVVTSRPPSQVPDPGDGTGKEE